MVRVKLGSLVIGLCIDRGGFGIARASRYLRFSRSFSQNDSALAVCIRPDARGFFLTFRAVLLGLAFTLGPHAPKDGTLVFRRQVCALDAHVQHFDTVTVHQG